ncbi:unnamed protein product, partial [Ectocarpus sp. 12 AP-2014]
MRGRVGGVVGGSFAVVTRVKNGSCCVCFAASWKGWSSDAGRGRREKGRVTVTHLLSRAECGL